MNARRFLQQNEIFSLLSVFFLVTTAITLREKQQAHAELARTRAALVAAEKERDELREQMAPLLTQLKTLQVEVDRLQLENAALKKELAKRPSLPVTMRLEEKEGFRFERGSSVLTNSFTEKFDAFVVQIEEQSEIHGFDRIEVVGHTDQQRHRNWITIKSPSGETTRVRKPNLDLELVPVLHGLTVGLAPRAALEQGQLDAQRLEPGSNVDLGMMRAVAVVRLLRQEQQKGRLRKIRFILPLSAGELILPNNQLAEWSEQPPDEPDRRRIDVWLRSSAAIQK